MLLTETKRMLVVWAAFVLLGFMRPGECATPEIVSDKELPKTGNLSTSSISGAASATFPDPFGAVDPSGKEESPITGSVSRLTADEWVMKVFNNSKNAYSVIVDVVQRDDRGSEVRRDSYTYMLKPESSEQRKVPAGVGAKEAELNLRNWKDLTKKPARKAAEAIVNQE